MNVREPESRVNSNLMTAKCPIADLHVSHEFVPTSETVFTHVNILQQENQSQKELQATLLPLITHPTPPNAFLMLLSPN